MGEPTDLHLLDFRDGTVTVAERHLEPVEIEIRRDHAYKKKKPRTEVKGAVERRVKPPGCAACGGARWARQHLGAPPSLNEGGSGMDRMAFQALKGAWQWALADALEASGLPRGLEAVTAEVLVGFETRASRDEGNLRWMIEKALGDALVDGYWKRVEGDRLPALLEADPDLVTRPAPRSRDKVDVRVVEGGWLPDDSFWPVRRYSMGNLEGRHAPRESWTRVALFPRLPVADSGAIVPAVPDAQEER
jgi:hypothetical protein